MRNYDAELLADAYRAAQLSRDPSTQNGAIIARGTLILAARCNNFPAGVDDTIASRWERPVKYDMVSHAEENAILECAAVGAKTAGNVMYSCWAPCSACARAIIGARLHALVVHKERMAIEHERWRESIERAIGMLKEAGVHFWQYSGPIDAPPIRVSGKLWSPKVLAFC